MKIDKSGDDTTRRYTITGISGDQFDKLIKDLNPELPDTPVGNREARWRGNSAVVIVTVAKASTGADVDRLIERSTGASI